MDALLSRPGGRGDRRRDGGLVGVGRRDALVAGAGRAGPGAGGLPGLEVAPGSARCSAWIAGVRRLVRGR